MYPYGRTGTEVYNVVKALMPEDNIHIALDIECAACANRTSASVFEKGISPIDHHRQTIALTTISHDVPLSMSTWVSYVLSNLTDDAHECGMELASIQTAMMDLPEILPIETDGLGSINIERSLEVETPYAEKTKYTLRSVIYSGDNHFVLFMFRKDGRAWYADGQVNDGSPINRGTHRSIKNDQLQQIYGTGSFFDSAEHNRKVPAVLFYAKQHQQTEA